MDIHYDITVQEQEQLKYKLRGKLQRYTQIGQWKKNKASDELGYKLNKKAGKRGKWMDTCSRVETEEIVNKDVPAMNVVLPLMEGCQDLIQQKYISKINVCTYANSLRTSLLVIHMEMWQAYGLIQSNTNISWPC